MKNIVHSVIVKLLFASIFELENAAGPICARLLCFIANDNIFCEYIKCSL